MGRKQAKRERSAPVGTILKAQGHKAKRNNWQTPEHVLERVRLLSPDGNIALDPATARDNPTRAGSYFALAACPRCKGSGEKEGDAVELDGELVEGVCQRCEGSGDQAPGEGMRDRLLGVNGGEWLGTNGLTRDWRKTVGDGLVFCNPPYGAAAGGNDWFGKLGQEGRKGCRMVAFLGVSRTEQGYLIRMLREASLVCFVRGRVAFRNPDTGEHVGGNCYASWALGFNIEPWRFRHAFEPLAGTTTLQDRGERSACFELRAL